MCKFNFLSIWLRSQCRGERRGKVQATRQGKVNGNGRRAGGGRLEPGGKSNTAGRPRLAAGHNSHEICKDAHHPLILRLILHGINPKMNYPLACLPPPRGAPTPLPSTVPLGPAQKSAQITRNIFRRLCRLDKHFAPAEKEEHERGEGKGEGRGAWCGRGCA